MRNSDLTNLTNLFYEFCFNIYGFLVIIVIDTRDHQVMDMDQVVMVVAVVVILLQIFHRVISEIVVTQEMATPIGGQTKIIDGITIEDHHRQTPTPSASFFLGCDTVSKPFCV